MAFASGPPGGVGDGINDAPALTQVEVGIAFGSGADIAIDSADAIHLERPLRAVLQGIRALLAFLNRGHFLPQP